MSGCLYTSPRLAADSSGLLGHILIILLLSSLATAEVLLLPITWLVGWVLASWIWQNQRNFYLNIYIHIAHVIKCTGGAIFPGHIHIQECAHFICKVIFALCAVSSVRGPGFKRGFAKISQSRRRFLLRPFPGQKHLLVVSYKRHYAKQAPKHSK